MNEYKISIVDGRYMFTYKCELLMKVPLIGRWHWWKSVDIKRGSRQHIDLTTKDWESNFNVVKVIDHTK